MGTVRRVLAACVVAALLAVAAAASAGANGGPHDDDEDAEARVLVFEAIALIVNTPHDEHAIEDKIEHALEAQHHEGVDLGFVEEAAAAIHDGDLEGARELLQTAIGAGPVVGEEMPEPIREAHGDPGRPAVGQEMPEPIREGDGDPRQPFAVGAETGTALVLDEFHPSTALDGGNIMLLVASAAAIALGAVFAWRFRPPDTVRQLRRARVPE